MTFVEKYAMGDLKDTVEHRQQELHIQALGAAISRRDWHATERAFEAIRDKFDGRYR